MHDSFYLSSTISPATKKVIGDIIECADENFGSLVAIAGLVASSDFRYANLDNVVFDDSDLRGFDFTGASLRHTSWKNAKWDSTTILAGADLDGSDLEAIKPSAEEVIDTSVLRRHWTDIVIWMDRLRAGGPTHKQDMAKVLLTLFEAKDSFVRRHALKTLRKYLSFDELLGLLKTSVFDAQQGSLVNPAFSLLKQLHNGRPKQVQSFVIGLMRGRYVAEAAIFLAEFLETQTTLNHLVAFVSRNESPVVRKRFIASLASRHGEVISIMTRAPVVGDAFDFDAEIGPRTVALIGRAVLRMASDEVNQMRAQRNFGEFLSMDPNEIEFLVLRRLREINSAGLGWKVCTTSEMYDYQLLREKSRGNKDTSLWLP